MESIHRTARIGSLETWVWVRLNTVLKCALSSAAFVVVVVVEFDDLEVVGKSTDVSCKVRPQALARIGDKFKDDDAFDLAHPQESCGQTNLSSLSKSSSSGFANLNRE